MNRVSMLHLRVIAGTGGGPEKTILNSPRFIKPFGYDAHVAYLCPPDDPIRESLQERAAKAACPLTIIDDRGARDWRVVRDVVRLCRMLKIDLMQAHDYKSNAIGLIARRFHRCRLATMLHGWTDMSGRMPLYAKIDRWCLPFYESLICVSADLVEECRKLRIPESKVHLVHNAIDTDVFRRQWTIDQAKERIGASKNSFLVGSVGRLSPEKCFVPLIDAVSVLRSSGMRVDLWIAGDGAQRDILKAHIQQLGLNDSVKLLGQLPDTKELFQAMDLFVLNSVREGLPNVVLEAMALGAPVIATRIAGIPSLIHDGITGRLIEPGNQESLVATIREAIENPLRLKDYAEKARNLIEREFSFAQRMQKIASIYDRLLSRQP